MRRRQGRGKEEEEEGEEEEERRFRTRGNRGVIEKCSKAVVLLNSQTTNW
jgi:hypothetical protein